MSARLYPLTSSPYPQPTVRVLFVPIVLAHDRRKIVHFNVTEHPTAAWTSQQKVETFCDGKLPRFLIRGRDGVYGLTFWDFIYHRPSDSKIENP